MASNRPRREQADGVQVLPWKDWPVLETSRGEVDVAADILEHYIRFRSKSADMSLKGWLDLLELTMPKLKRRRGLLEIHNTTRLCFVMMLVGSMRNPSLASRAIMKMLVDHWRDKGPCSFLQKDAIRHAAVVCAASTEENSEKESLARQLEAGIEDALDGAGLEELGVFADWSREEDLLFAGGAEAIREEVAGLAKACREASSNARARLVLEDYVKKRKMDTFEEDFMAWARVQLEKLPPTLFDRAGFTASATPSTPKAKNSPGVSRGASGGASSSADRARGRGTATRGVDKNNNNNNNNESSGRVGRTISSNDCENDGSSSSARPRRAGKKRPSSAPPASVSPSVSPVPSRAASKLGLASGSGPGADSRMGAEYRRNGSGSRGSGPRQGSRRGAPGVEDDAGDNGPFGNSSARASGGGPSDGGKDADSGRGRDKFGGVDLGYFSSSSESDEEPEEYLPEDYLPSASKGRSERKRHKRKKRKESRRSVAATPEEEAAKAMAEKLASRSRPRRAGKRNQGELFEGDQVIHAAKTFGQPTRWVPGVVTCNRKDGTYDVFLATGGVVCLVRRVDLYHRQGSIRSRASREGRPEGCPAAVYESADVVADRRGGEGGGGGTGAGGMVGGGAGEGGSVGSARRRGRGRTLSNEREAVPVGRRVGVRPSRARIVIEEDDDDTELEEKEEESEDTEAEAEEHHDDGDDDGDDDDDDEDYYGGNCARDARRFGCGARSARGDGRVRATARTTNRTGNGSDTGESSSGRPVGRNPRTTARRCEATTTPKRCTQSGAVTRDDSGKAKGKGPSRLTNTPRQARSSSPNGAGSTAPPPPPPAAAETGVSPMQASPQVRPGKQASRAASTSRLSYYEIVSEDDDSRHRSSDSERVTGRPNRRGGGSGSGEENRGFGVQTVRRQVQGTSEPVGDSDGRTAAPSGAASHGGGKHGGGGGVSSVAGGALGGRKAAKASNAPSDSEIAAHIEGAAGWGWGGSADSDSDGSSDDSATVVSRRRRPKRKGKSNL